MHNSNSLNKTAANTNGERLLFAVFSSAVKQGESETEAIEAVRAAGGDQHLVRRNYLCGRIAASLGYGASANSFSVALAVLAKKGFVGQEDEINRRSLKEEKAYKAARVAWCRLLEKAEIRTLERRGGPRQQNSSRQRREDATVKFARKRIYDESSAIELLQFIAETITRSGYDIASGCPKHTKAKLGKLTLYIYKTIEDISP